MRFSYLAKLHIPLLAVVFLTSCDDKKEEFITEKVSEYIPLAVGKYITYRVDSMVFTNFGRNTEYRKYQVKHEVNAIVTDNLGRSAYRIFTYLRDSAGTQPWSPGKTYLVTPLSDQIEVLSEENFRYIKLHMPISNGFTWKGNKYLPLNPYGGPNDPVYQFSNDDNMGDWEYFYDGQPGSFSYRGNNYANVITVEEIDEAFNVPIVSTSSYAAKTRSVEKYSKNIGLVYREYEIWEYQPNTGNPAGPYKTGFGVTMWMIDRN